MAMCPGRSEVGGMWTADMCLILLIFKCFSDVMPPQNEYVYIKIYRITGKGSMI